jgi:hypothetical protein
MFRTALVLAVGLPCLARAQSAGDMVLADYQRQRDAQLADAGQRHLQVGSWARKQGLVPQSASEFVRAVEVAEGKCPGATTVLGLMRSYGEAFWRGNKKHPQKALLSEFARRARVAHGEDRKMHLRLAKLAQKAKLDDRQREHLLAALRLGAELEWATAGPKVDGVAVATELAGWLEQQCRAVNGAERRFDAVGTRVPKLDGVVEVATDRLVVRTDLPFATAQQLHALGTALLPLLQDRLEGAPVRALGLFVFAHRKDYTAYLEACGHGAASAGRGLCDYGSFQTLVCAEDLPEADLHAITLHELSHLFFFGASPVAMPDWYAEGLAESFGGQGTFAWDGKTLRAGDLMRRDRLDELKAAPLPLREMLAADAAQLLATDRVRGLRYYAQCWALQRFLRDTDNPWRARFGWWEDECRGALPGVESTARLGNPGPAAQAFERLFGKDLDALEKAFLVWLAAL